jgi:hypothetical protein
MTFDGSTRPFRTFSEFDRAPSVEASTKGSTSLMFDPEISAMKRVFLIIATLALAACDGSSDSSGGGGSDSATDSDTASTIVAAPAPTPRPKTSFTGSIDGLLEAAQEVLVFVPAASDA